LKVREQALWVKSLYLSHLLRNSGLDVDWILYLDTDALVMNMDFDLARLLSDETTTDVVVTYDAGGINTGAFLLHNSMGGQRIMDAWARGAELAQGRNDQEYFRDMFNDRGMLKPEAEGNIVVPRNLSQPMLRIVPPCALQSAGGLEWDPKYKRPFWEGAYARGDFVVHFLAVPTNSSK